MKKKTKLKIGFFLGMFISIVISVLISALFSMYYLSHLYKLSSINAKTSIHINKRIDMIDKKINDRYSNKEALKPASL